MARARSPLSGLSVSALRSEIRQREQALDKLRKRHKLAAAKVDRLAERIRDLGGDVMSGSSRGRVGRARNAVPLHKALHTVLKGKTMGAAEASEALLKSGFKTSSRTFRDMVNIALIRYTDLFKRVERGQYTAK